MKPKLLLDTGPLVAFLNRRDQYHSWAKSQMAEIKPPLFSCEPVLSEACFLLRGSSGGAGAVVELVSRGLVRIAFNLEEEAKSVKKMLSRYENIPISLADACLVRMSELLEGSVLITLDSDFRIYRKSNRQVIPTIMPKNIHKT